MVSNFLGGRGGDDGGDGGLFARLVSATMACLFDCFRIKDSSSRLVSQPFPSTEVVAEKRNPSFSQLISEGDYDDSQLKENETKQLESRTQAEFDVEDLNNEASFLKACGTLPETPPEIRKVSMGCKGPSDHKEEPENSKIRSWLMDTLTENISSENKQLPLPATPSEELINETVSLEQTLNSCMTNKQNHGGISSSSGDIRRIQNVTAPTEVQANEDYCSATSSTSCGNLAPSVQFKNKSVRFDCDFNSSSISSRSALFDIASEILEGSDGAGGSTASKQSPYPTPLKLSDEMQTPGTVFPAYLDDIGNGQKTRIRSQYVYSLLNPVQNFSQWKDLKDGYFDSNQPSDRLGESIEQVDELTSVSEKGMGETSIEEELNIEASLSSWLKPPVTKEKGSRYSISCENLHFGESPAERPIIGMVAAHCNDDEPSCISPKWRDGNGIPNTTNKYKEDQKVKWHATPFEKRLEKALSEEKFIS